MLHNAKILKFNFFSGFLLFDKLHCAEKKSTEALSARKTFFFVLKTKGGTSIEKKNLRLNNSQSAEKNQREDPLVSLRLLQA